MAETANAISEYLAGKLAGHVLRGIEYTPPSAVYLSLHLADGSEVTGGGYERLAVAFGAAVGRSQSNTTDLLFPIATTDWGTITSFSLWDAAEDGNALLTNCPLNEPETVTTNRQYRLPPGSVVVTW